MMELSWHDDIVAAERGDIAHAKIAHGATYLCIENGERAARSGSPAAPTP